MKGHVQVICGWTFCESAFGNAIDATWPRFAATCSGRGLNREATRADQSCPDCCCKAFVVHLQKTQAMTIVTGTCDHILVMSMALWTPRRDGPTTHVWQGLLSMKRRTELQCTRLTCLADCGSKHKSGSLVQGEPAARVPAKASGSQVGSCQEGCSGRGRRGGRLR